MNYEVYSYWNILELEGVFNAIAALTASSDFTGLLRLLAMVAIISLVLAVLSGRARHEDFWRWVIMLALINGMLLVPKATVILVDRTSSQPSRVVANVPIGLAALAHGTSKIGDWLTRAYETVFALPNDLQFQKNGLMFGHRLLTESVKFTPEIVNGRWMRDFQEFWRECVMPDIASNYLPIDTLRNSHDFWGELNNTNPALYVTLSTVGTVNCPSAYTDLTNRLNTNVIPAVIQLQADMYFPGQPANATNLKNALTQAYAFGLGVTNTAESIVKQQVSINAGITAYCETFAQLGDANKASLCYSSAMGAHQTNYTYQVLTKIAESSMPKLKSAIEMIQYAVFPIILAFAIVAGHMGLPVLKTYVMSLVWVQLWAPLYAVIHYIQTVRLPEYANQLAGLGDTLAGQASLLQMGISDQAVAGMLVVVIPPIAAALVKGGEVGLQAVAGLVSAPKTAEQQAAANAKGNETIGHWDAAMTIRQGNMVRAFVNPDGSVTYTNADGSERLDVGSAIDRASFKVSTARRVSRVAEQMSEQAETAAVGNMVSAGTETAAAFQQVADFVRAHAKGANKGTSFSEDDMAKISQAYSQAQDIAKNFEKQFGLREGTGARVLGELSVSGGGKILGVGVEASLKAAGFSEATLSNEKKMSEAFKLAKSFKDAMERAHQVSRQSKYDTGESSEAKAMRGIRASLDQAQRHSELASANYQKSLDYKEHAKQAREGSVTFDVDLTTRLMNRLANERATIDGQKYNGFKREDVDALVRLNNPEMLALLERLADEETAKALEEKYGGIQRPKDVWAFFKQGQEGLQTNSDVATQGEQWLGKVHGDAARAGVDPDKQVTSNLPGQVNKGLEQTGNAVNNGGRQVEAGGKPLRQDVNGTVKNPGSLMIRAGKGAALAVRDTAKGAWKALGGSWREGEKTSRELINQPPNAPQQPSAQQPVQGSGDQPTTTQPQPTAGSDGQQNGDTPPPRAR
ncbi:conjugal transfer protein TraG N-terminal domain-containing protein [Sulfuricystis multivorans]|uniref:conjugal transfer protein TraG N-terminal domain-containing protein n=1 Tax=Sulfuricystis multivorans TaxID=2211108 RepID=UPI001559805F|nr:conjugal transfer protein TraG N-terminal domain-containing protein [Sulfuricystis multivorans]